MSFREDITALVEANAHGPLASGNGWSRVPLGEVARIINGFAFESKFFSPDRGVPLIRIRDVVEGSSDTRYSGPIPEGYTVENGDLLVGMDGDFNSAYWKGGSALLNQRVCKIVPDETRLRRGFLGYALPAYLKLINEHTSSVTVKHLSSRTLQALPIPLPAVEVQDAIVARIDELFVEINEGEVALAGAHKNLALYKDALIYSVATGELTADWRQTHEPSISGEAFLNQILARHPSSLPKTARGKSTTRNPVKAKADDFPKLPSSWCWASLDQLSSLITSGSRAWSPYYDRGDCVFIMAQNVRPGRYDTRFVQRVDPPLDDPERRRTAVDRNDLLLTIVGANTGDLCQVKFEPKDHFVCQSVALLRPIDATLGALVELFFTSTYGRALQMDRLIYGAGRPHLSFDQIRGLAIPVPPPEEAAVILDRVTALTDRIPTNALLGIDPASLRKSILAAAFRGDLVA